LTDPSDAAPTRNPGKVAEMAAATEVSAFPADLPAEAMKPSNAQTNDALHDERWRTASEELRRIFEDVGVKVGLNEAESDTLIALLVDQRIRYAEAPGLDTSIDGMAARRELDAQHRQEIETLIGADRARRLAEYQRSIQVRYEVENLRKRLANSALALTETQRKQLIQAGIERRAYAGPTVFTGGESDFAVTQEQFARNELAYQRLMDAARDVLTAEQIARVEAWWTQDRQANDAFLRQMEQQQRKRQLRPARP
jgi:hypothetical protein